jgi:hypothetical protein
VHGLAPADISRRVLSLAAAVAMPLIATAAVALASPAQAGTAQVSAVQAGTRPAAAGQAGGTQASRAGQVSIVIDSMSPQTARAGSTVTVTGTVSNRTSQAKAGLDVRLMTSPVRFQSRDQMDGYASQGTGASLEQAGSPFVIAASLKPGATAAWRASFRVSDVGMTEFGVYPVTAQLADADGGPLASDHTLLPFWPGQQAAELRRPLDIGWSWPLIDQPHHQVCTALTNNDLAASLAAGGRLSNLLSAARAHPDADVTWVVDPALVSDAATMTKAYQVASGQGCSGAVNEPASNAAQSWLSALRQVTSVQPTVITPYANADVSALVHNGLSGELARAYTMGYAVAGSVLDGSFGPSIALPAGGTADLSVLSDLSTAQHIGTVVLDSSEMPPASAGFEPDDAVTSVKTGQGAKTTVLLADHVLTGVLAQGDTSSGDLSPGTQFAVSQRFLAETAMIAAEAPDTDRSVVVAPPQGWSPTASLAGELLSETASTPWLAPQTLSGVASAQDSERGMIRKPLATVKNSPGELSAGYLGAVSAVGTRLDVYQDLLDQPSGSYLQGLNQALVATESAAWRRNEAQGLALAGKLSAFMSGEEGRVKIITAQQVPMGGSSGPVPVSVQNGSQHAVQVRLNASVVNVPNRTSQLAIGHFQNLVTVQPQQEVTVKLPVSSAPIGPTAIRLSLSTASGKPLSRPPTSLTVESTRYGRAILFLIGAAIGVLVLTSVFRGIRRSLRARTHSVPEEEDLPGSVVTGISGTRHPTEAPDDLADARRWVDDT